METVCSNVAMLPDALAASSLSQRAVENGGDLAPYGGINIKRGK
jgi:hypothetical protein